VLRRRREYTTVAGGPRAGSASTIPERPRRIEPKLAGFPASSISSTMFGEWIQQRGALSEAFAGATPFPHVVIEGFLSPLAKGVLSEFPDLEEMESSHDYIFGKKRQLNDVATRGSYSRQLEEMLLSAEFAEAISAIVGQDRKLFVDPSFHGGGFHQGWRRELPRHPRRLQRPPRSRRLAQGPQHPPLHERGLARPVRR
jgi:hypothetical protein